MERLALYPARVVSGVVEINQGGEWKPSSDTMKVSQGEADSSGFALIGEDLSFYIVNTQPDLQTTINKLIDTAQELINLCNVQTWVIAATGQVLGANPEALAIGVSVEAIKSELEAFELK